MVRVKEWLNTQYQQTKCLLRNIPSIVVALFVLSVVLMNLTANKTIVSLPWLALDAAFLFLGCPL